MNQFMSLSKDDVLTFCKDVGIDIVEISSDGKVKRFEFLGKSGRRYSVTNPSSYLGLDISAEKLADPETVKPEAENADNDA